MKECSDLDNCVAKFNPFVKHSTEKFHPFPEKVFDMWLCVNYWEHLDWDVPVDDRNKDVICMCDFVCGHSSHIDDELSHCTK